MEISCEGMVFGLGMGYILYDTVYQLTKKSKVGRYCVIWIEHPQQDQRSSIGEEFAINPDQ